MVLLLAVAGCGAFHYRTYPLPLSSTGARFTYGAIARVASSQGLEVVRFDDAVHVRLDEVTWAYFTVQLDEFNLVIQVDADAVSPSEEAQHFEAARLRAESIWKQALLQLSLEP